MSTAPRTHEEVPTSEGQRRGLITGVVAGPLAWFAQLQATYALVPWACARGHRFVLLAATLGAVAISVLGGLAAWKSWRGHAPLPGEPREIEGARLLSLLGIALSVSFVVVLLASAIPTLILGPCD